MALPRVYVLGDSISIHYGPYLEQYLQGSFSYARKAGEQEALLDLDTPQGANGGDSSMVLAFLQAMQVSQGLDADVMLLNCGLHDLRTTPQTQTQQVPLSDYQQNLQAIIALVQQMRPKLVWIRTTPCDESVHNKPHKRFHRFAADCVAYNAAADAVMAAAGIPSIDLYTFTLNLGPDLYCDHVHFHEPIRALQAAYIAGWLQRWRG